MDIMVGYNYSCVVLEFGIICWGVSLVLLEVFCDAVIFCPMGFKCKSGLCKNFYEKGQVTDIFVGLFFWVVAGYSYICGIRVDYILVCWGFINGKKDVLMGSNFVDFVVGFYYICVIDID